ncbi:CDP-glycerol glycerophosphotransferase family protein [Aequorivita capsosiphonis]|uniref:CDP-glycerol glycerophosphotransferase family protein n=1 Tax=Aequorivita capsosiphonis TaxID=487317 RepID=UPI000414EF89|nr:CDP-glycerol glycerophosphotransferase family protein [Aequorivita capsosiphonis]
MEYSIYSKIKLFVRYQLGEILNLFIKPDPSFWIFSSSYNLFFNYNSKYLFEYVLENHPEINCKFVINGDKERKELTEIYGDYFIETKTLKGIRTALKAGVWITSAGMPIYLLFSGRRRIIFNVWHGVPLKRIGFLDKSISRLQRIYTKLYFSNNYSFITTPSSKLISLYASSFDVNEDKIRVLGQPRNDLLSKQLDRNIWIDKLYPKLPDFEKIILYAPTFRDYGETQLFPFDDYDIELLNSFLKKENLIIFIRFHQSETSLIKEKADGRIQFINSVKINDINAVLNCFDLLITDYSSIYLDHLITEKPQLFLPYDIKRYSSNEGRGFNFNYDEFTPGPKPKTQEEFISEIKSLLNNDNYYLEERDKLNNFVNEIRYNSSSEIVRFLKKELNLK